jgi:CTP:molybdopterin cytidylyltransferase MocA
MPPHERMATPRPDFLMGAAKWEWLRGSKVLLNLHRGQSVSLEWVRVLEALCNGCVVVSEHSVDYQPLEPGRHIVFGHWRALGELADRLLSDPAELDRVRHAAYAFLTNELTMRPSARRLVELAGDLLSSPGRCQSAPSTTRPVEPDAITSLRASEHDGAVYVPSQLPDLPPGARPALAHSLRRPVERPRRRPELARTPPRAAGSVDAIVVQGRGDPSPGMTVASILGQGEALDLQVLVGLTEKETKRSAPALRDPRVVVEDDDPASTLGAVRNRLLARSDADYVLVVEPVDTLLPGALHRLAEVLQQSSGVEACYPMTAEADGEIGNALPFEPDRLEEHDYLSTPALWRRDALVALGGWCDDPQLEALESYDLWHRLAAAGGSAELLPQALVRRRLRPLRLLRLSDIDPERTRHALRSRTERCSQVGSSL